MTPVVKEEKPVGDEMKLALLLQAIDDLEGDFAEQKKDYAARKEVLINQKRALQRDIITGQKSLLDQEPASA